ncbi:MAG: ABC transporter substrate-binding protein [Rhodospirillales bacterium]|nr:ABC transporter substrate-binding protein [Rhodospirillales bacterium]
MKLHSTIAILGLAALGLATSVSITADAQAANKKCLFVSSYHRGYQHADDVEQGLRSVLKGKCDVRQFDMDTKRLKSEAMKQKQALEAKAIIESWKPDIVITADDNAAKYLIKPYYKDHKLPFVFCGLNWTAAEYGFPYSNATGMIEVGPIIPMLERARKITGTMERVFYVGADALSEEKNLKRFQRAAERLGFKLEYALAGTTDAWLKAYQRAQDYDFVIIGNRHGIKDWDHDKAVAGMLKITRKLSVTNHSWMMPYTILGVTKVSREQGEWAAKIALKILGGMPLSNIPIVPNSRRDIWINGEFLKVAEVKFSPSLLRKGKKFAGLKLK